MIELDVDTGLVLVRDGINGVAGRLILIVLVKIFEIIIRENSLRI